MWKCLSVYYKMIFTLFFSYTYPHLWELQKTWPFSAKDYSGHSPVFPFWKGGCELSVQFSSFQLILVAQSCPIICNAMNCSTPGLPVHHQLPEFIETHVHWVRDAIQPSHPLSSPSPALNLSQHRGLFKWVSSSHQVAKVLEFQLQHWKDSSNEHPGLISFRMDWLDLLAVQGTLKSLLQHHSSNLSIKPCLKQFLPDDFSLM